MIAFIKIIFFMVVFFFILVNFGTWGLPSFLVIFDLDFLNLMFMLLMSFDWLLFVLDRFIDMSFFLIELDADPTNVTKTTSPAIIVSRASLFVGIISIVLFFFNMFIVSFLFLFDVFNDCVSYLVSSGGLTMSNSIFFIFMFFVFNSFFVYICINRLFSKYLEKVNRLKLNLNSLKKQLIS